jgi:hypothetical protein
MAGYRWYSVALIVLCSCGKTLPEMDGFNRELWIHDKNACDGNRTNMIGALEQEKDKLLALTEMQVVEVLGKPDQHELYKRNQKFYHYFLTPASTCGQADSTTRRLTLRFNAMGLVKEISME